MMSNPTNKIFVRNLPYTCTNEQLEAAFKDDGPIKNCFVVRDKGSTGRCKGIGFVTFALKEDAERAITERKEIGGRILQAAVANKKSESKQAKESHMERQKQSPVVKKMKVKDEAIRTEKPEEKVEEKEGDDEGIGDEVNADDSDDEDDDDDDDDSDDDNNDNVGDDDDDGSDDDDEDDDEDEDEDDDGDDDKEQKDEDMEVEGDIKTQEDIKKQLGGRGQKRKSGEEEGSVTEMPEKKQKVGPERKITVKNVELPCKTQKLMKVFKQFGKVSSCYMMPNNQSSTSGMGCAVVIFESEEAKKKALSFKKPLKFNGKRVFVGKFETESTNQAHSVSEVKDQGFQIIIRNLSFQCTEEELAGIFGKFGKVLDTKIPTRQVKGKFRKRGFGFIRYKTQEEAVAAVDAMNGKEIKDRPVAVDKVKPKNEYMKLKQDIEKEKKSEVDVQKGDPKNDGRKEKAEIKDGDDASDQEDEETGSDESEDENDESSEEDDDDDSMEEEEIGSDDDDDDGDNDSKEEKERQEEEEVSDGDDEKESDDEDGDMDKNKKYQSDRASMDIEEGRTIFIRNLPFEVEQKEVQSLFNKFGTIKYCSLVRDQMTGLPRGSAFVQYEKLTEAQKCLAEAAKEDNCLVLHDRQLNAAKALSRDKATEVQEKRKKIERMEEKDKRNMYLLMEGFIRPGTAAAKGLSESDLRKRAKVETVKRAKIKNMFIFVSKTRLVVHNLPMSVDDKKLKDVFKSAVTKNGVKVIEAKVMRDTTKVGEEGRGKSLGFGFVSFSEHQHALEALREVNNNPDYFGADRRPIVGFSLENKKALEKKEWRQQRSKETRNKKGVTSQKQNTKTATSVIDVESDPRAVSVSEGKKGLTSHANAKMRWRDRGKRAEEVRKVKKMKRMKFTQQQTSKRESQGKMERVPVNLAAVHEKTNPKKRRASKGFKEEKRFDSLVAQYKEQLSGSTFVKKGKWFEG